MTAVGPCKVPGPHAQAGHAAPDAAACTFSHATDAWTPTHLVVLQHGLWGKAENVSFVEQLLHQHVKALQQEQQQGQQQQERHAGAEARNGGGSHAAGGPPHVVGLHGMVVRTLNADVNAGKASYDGVDLCGDRLVDLIKQTVTTLADTERLRVTQISFIGYSLGGLICRYAVGKLEHEGVLISAAPAQQQQEQQYQQHQQGANGSTGAAREAGGSQQLRLQAVNFVTISTPHLGARRPTEGVSWIVRTHSRAWNAMAAVIASSTGCQLMLKDKHAFGQPLLLVMAEPGLPFMQGLRRFERLLLLANTHGDQMVPYRTAAITMQDPYQGRSTEPRHESGRYPSVVQPWSGTHPPRKQTTFPWWFVLVLLVLLPLLLLVALVLLPKMLIEGWLHSSSLKRQAAGRQPWLVAGPGNCGSASGGNAGGNRGIGGGGHVGRASVAASPTAVVTGVPCVRFKVAAHLEHASANGTTATGGEREAGEDEHGLSGEASALSKIVLEERERAHLVPPAAAVAVAVPSTPEGMMGYMAEQLNTLPWEKIDVDTRHHHAHAAIVLRPKAGSQMVPAFRWKASDQLEYMLSRMQW